jgi:MinD superfamily P-loop ATPase
MKELVVISGKGGTGKTSVVAAMARLAGTSMLADCDVDAADLHLVLAPELGEPHEFSGRSQAVIDASACIGCGLCVERCRFDALALDPPRVDGIACEGCGLCVRICPVEALRMEPVVNGYWWLSGTEWGPLVHARLGVAEDNSGKLVTLVRNEARRVAEERGLDFMLVDGAPGIGCPVIASLSGASMVLIVTEPTVAGRHDLGRVLDLVRHFRLPFAVCINKYDLNLGQAHAVEAEAETAGALFVATVRYDRAVTDAMVAGKSIVDLTTEGAGADLIDLWGHVDQALAEVVHGTESE